MSKPEVRPHWSFWTICIVALIWNMMGSANFLMQMNPEMLAQFPEPAQSLVASRPYWATIAFALAVFGGVIADILLLLKKGAAYYLFVGALVGVIVTNIHTFLESVSIDIWVGSLMSLVVAAFLVWYSRLAAQKGWIS